MSQCACRFLRGLWSCIMGSLRMILFFGTLILLLITLIQLTTLFRVSHHGQIDRLPRTPMQMHIYAVSAFSLIIALLGVYGSFYRHKGSLQLFSILTVVHCVVTVGFIVCATSKNSIEHTNNHFRKQLEAYQPLYSWQGERPGPIHDEATEVWDTLQSAACCGLDGPNDWAPFRPDSVAHKSVYPRSCCGKYADATVIIIDASDIHVRGPAANLRGSNSSAPEASEFGSGELLCQDDGTLYKTGCLKRVKQFEFVVLLLVCTMLSIQVPLAIIACCVAGHVGSRDRPDAAAANTNSTQMRVDFARHHQMQGHVLPAKIYLEHGAPIYPDLHQHQQHNLQPPSESAPPRYGSFD